MMAPSPYLQYDDPAIVAPVDNGSLMSAAAAYIFWPVYPPFMMLQTPRSETYLRFHYAQAMGFGAITSVVFIVITVILASIFRGVTPESLWFGAMLTAVFLGWVVALLFLFCLYLLFAWRAGRGDVFRVLIIGAMLERWVLASALHE